MQFFFLLVDVLSFNRISGSVVSGLAKCAIYLVTLWLLLSPSIVYILVALRYTEWQP